jgi:membrane protease YdiL (CAAX protease family)
MGLICVLGIVMGSVFVWRRSLVPVIVLHFVFNSIELMALYLSSPEWK